MSDWRALRQELEAWRQGGRRATLWWRDDDAEEPSAALDRLLALAADHDLSLALAVVPAGAGRPLAAVLGGRDDVAVLTHGLSHRNLAPDGARKAEFGPGRPVFEMLADAATGWHRLRLLFGNQALPVFVPPWNRMAPDLLPRLANAEFRALSSFGPRPAAIPAPGLSQTNCHVDLIDWRGSRGFVGEAAALAALLAHLAARRAGRVDAAEASGIMTHHRCHDGACWSFLERLFAETRAHPGAHWLSPAEAFNLPP